MPTSYLLRRGGSIVSLSRTLTILLYLLSGTSILENKASITTVYAADLGSPTDYAPVTAVQCPDVNATPLVREFTADTQELHPREVEFVQQRESTVVKQAWYDWVGDGDLSGDGQSDLGYDLKQLEAANFSRVGIAFSGGGYRAAQYGAGVLKGLDARDEDSKNAGTGGLLQVATYMSGLSGGSWLTGSMYFNNWPTVDDMIFGNGNDLEGWLLDLDLATPDGDNLFDDENQYFFGSILWSIMAKANTGLDTSITDPWARMISYHFLNGTTRDNFFTNDSAHGAGQFWSHIPNIPAFASYETPFPLITIDSRPANFTNTTILPPEPVVYEVTPFEFGSWDPNLSAMVNLTYVGTHFNNKTPPNDTACVTGFDQAGFVMGSSASLFNQILDFAHNTLQGFSHGDASSLLYILGRQLTEVRTRADDVANWPNPFQSLKPDTFEDSNATWLNLIDGASNEENVPLGTHFVKARKLDVIVAVDASADDSTFLWPNGSSIQFSQQRMTNILKESHQVFPPIPITTDEFIKTGTNQRPTFFGCDPTSPPAFPLLIYLPNSPPVTGEDPASNTGTFQIRYTSKQSQVFIDQVQNNTMSGFVPNSLGSDPNYGKCLQCAAVDRSRMRANITRSDICQKCFDQYCYSSANPPSRDEIVGRKYAFVDPDPQGLSKVTKFLGRNKLAIGLGVGGLVAIVAVAVFFLRRYYKKRDREYKKLAMQAHDTDAPWKAYSDRLGSSFEMERK